MARVRDIEIEEVADDLKGIYRRFGAEYGPFLNQVKVFAHRPPALRHIMGMLLELKEESVLPVRYLEIALVVVSKMNECQYCVSHHTPRLVSTGLSSETAENILQTDCPGLNEIDRLVRDYSIQVTENAGRIPNKMYESLREHFTESQVVELTLRIALCGFFNRFNDALQIETEDEAIRLMVSADQH